VIGTQIRHRLLWVRRRGLRWAFAVENGGRAYNLTVVAYDLLTNGMAAGVGRAMAFPGTVCQLTERQLWRPEDEAGSLTAPIPPPR